MSAAELSLDDQEALLQLSRDSLLAAFSDNPDGPLEDFELRHSPLSATLGENRACFVTLSSRNGRLRGCVGCTSADQSLYKNIHFFTRAAAFGDPRFDPVRETELTNLVISITILGPLERTDCPNHLIIGRHGLYVRSRMRHGLLLAHVASKYKWPPDEFVRQTCLKAGLDPHQWQDYSWCVFEETEFSEV